MSAENKAVFLSYASQDADAARHICDALRTAGIEVWFDQSELRGGDAWDAKIRKQIKECALFVPVISANTQARTEGYFRLEWRLADQRTHLMAKGRPFLVPVAIDDTRDGEAHVPDSFMEVQWTRLHQGDPTSDFARQINRLLETPGSRPPTAGVAAAAKAPTRPPVANRRGASIAMVTVLAVLLVGGGYLLQRHFSAGGGGSQAADSTANFSEARKLVEKARAVFEAGDLVNRETYVLTEALLKKAEDLDVTEAEAWALHAAVSRWMVTFGLDISTERKEAMRLQAERAVKLAPTSVSARLAYATMLLSVGGATDEAEQILKPLLVEFPNDWRVLLAGGYLYRRQGQADEAAAVLQRARPLSDDHQAVTGDLLTVLVTAGRYAEAEAVGAETLARKSNGRVLEFDVRLKLNWRGDAAAAAAALARWPAWMLNEDRGVQCAAEVWMWNREPAKALAVLARFPRDYIRHGRFTGPRAALTAWLHEQVGNTQAAQADWKRTIQVTEKELAVAPSGRDALHALHWKAWALARLGDQAAAKTILRELIERNENSFRLNESTVGLVALGLVVGDTDWALAELKNIFSGQTTLGFVATRAVLDLNPIFDPVRHDPRFLAIRASAQAPESGKMPGPSVSSPDAKSVAVLAFENLSAEKDNEYFSEGISEELLNQLAKVPGLRVAARTSAFYFKGRNATAQEIGRTLDMAYVVDGTVRRIGNSVRVVAHLSRTDTGEEVWTEKFDGDLEKPWALQERIAGRIADALQVKLDTASQADRSINPEAYRLMLEGRYYWNQRSSRTEEVLTRAVQAYQRSLQLDPTFAEAHAGLGDVWVTRGQYRSMDGRSTSAPADYAQAKAEARRALELDARLAEPNVTLAYVAYCEREFAESERQFARAFAVNPNYALAHHWHALLLGAQGRQDRAVEEITRSLQLDPLSPNSLWSGTILNVYAGRLTEALADSERALELRPGVLPVISDRAFVLLKLGRKGEAIEAARQVGANPAADLRWWADGDAIYVLRESGEPAEATRHAEAALARFSAGDYRRAFVLAAIGRGEEALETLGTVPTLALGRMYGHPMWDPWRQDPRFLHIMARHGCAQEYQLARATLARMASQTRTSP